MSEGHFKPLSDEEIQQRYSAMDSQLALAMVYGDYRQLREQYNQLYGRLAEATETAMTEQQTKTLTGPGGIKLVLDKRQVNPDDPGAGTPAMVRLGEASATYWCAADIGELSGRDGQIVKVNSEQYEWLVAQSVRVDLFLYAISDRPKTLMEIFGDDDIKS